MLKKKFNESRKRSGYTKKSCKSQCVDHICMVGFIIYFINILKIILRGFLWKFLVKSQIYNFLLNKFVKDME